MTESKTSIQRGGEVARLWRRLKARKVSTETHFVTMTMSGPDDRGVTTLTARHWPKTGATPVIEIEKGENLIYTNI